MFLYNTLCSHSICNLQEACDVSTCYIVTFHASNALYTCFVSPNAYEDFAALLLQYQEKHPDMKWFYPYSESTPPDPGEALKSLITFISLREESV